MKNVFIISLLFIALQPMAFAQTMIKASTADKQVINVAVDGRYFNKRGTSVTVGDIPPGRHTLSIYGVVRKKNGKMREVVIYEGLVQTHNGMISIFVFDPATGGTNITEQDINEYRSNNKLPQGMPTEPYTQNGNYDNAGNSGSNDTDPPVASPAAIADPSTLTDDKTKDLKKKADAKKTDTEKMNVLKDALKNEQITTDQVAFMMDLLNFESTKLEFVKWAYTITVDKDNYGTLDVKFSYKNYQDEFVKFVQDNNK